MYQQVYDPVGGSLGLSSIFALLPIVALLVLLGGFHLRTHWAALLALSVGLMIAVAVYRMPIGQAALSAGEGAAFGLWPVLWIVVNAVCIFTMTALIVPLVVVYMVDGRRGLRETWPAAMVAGAAFALAQFIASNYISVGLTDVIASLCSVGAMMAFLRGWRPSHAFHRTAEGAPTHDRAFMDRVRAGTVRRSTASGRRSSPSRRSSRSRTS